MALVNETQILDFCENIIPPAPPDASQAQIEARNQVVTDSIPVYTKLFEYIVDFIEIQNVKVNTGGLLPEVPTVAPADGGATLHTATNYPNINNATLSQNNDGKGLVK